MKSYALLRKILFSFPPERSHHLSLNVLHCLKSLSLLKDKTATFYLPQEHMGLQFPNQIGLAAGLDKNADYFESLGCLGFGFVEVGTVTPKAQQGNAMPRLFRYPEQQAIVNRMGFNNKGIDYLTARIKNHSYHGILGVNIGKNKLTPNEKAIDDYLICLRKIYTHADYVAINISSPNTKGLRELQEEYYLKQLLENLKEEQLNLEQIHKRTVPLLLKISPDLNGEAINNMIAIINESGFEGVIATNTTISRPGFDNTTEVETEGGLSGKPVRPLSNTVLAAMSKGLNSNIVKIGVGGICSAENAREKISLGADLLQIYSGLIYQGPDLIQDIFAELKN